MFLWSKRFIAEQLLLSAILISFTVTYSDAHRNTEPILIYTSGLNHATWVLRELFIVP